jgi:hypothetical protein
MASGNPEASTVEETRRESILERTEQILTHMECLRVRALDNDLWDIPQYFGTAH